MDDLSQNGLVEAKGLCLLKSEGCADLGTKGPHLFGQRTLVRDDVNVFVTHGANIANIARKPTRAKTQKPHDQKAQNDPEKIPIFAFGRHDLVPYPRSSFMPAKGRRKWIGRNPLRCKGIRPQLCRSKGQNGDF